MAASYQTALSTWLSAVATFKDGFKAAVLETYGVDIGNNMLQYGSKVRNLPGKIPHTVKESIAISSDYSSLSSMAGAPLRTLQQVPLLGTSAITDISIDSFEKFNAWFIKDRTDIDFSALSAIEYGSSITEEQKQYIENALGYANN